MCVAVNVDQTMVSRGDTATRIPVEDREVRSGLRHSKTKNVHPLISERRPMVPCKLCCSLFGKNFRKDSSKVARQRRTAQFLVLNIGHRFPVHHDHPIVLFVLDVTQLFLYSI